MSFFKSRAVLTSSCLLVVILFHVACEVDMTVSLDGDNPPTFSLAGSGNLMFFSVMEVPPETQQQSIQRSSDNNRLLWKIEPSKDSVDKIRALPPITYGIVPAGFKQVFPADGSSPAPLTNGKVFQAGGTAFNANGGFIWFKVDEKKTWTIPIP